MRYGTATSALILGIALCAPAQSNSELLGPPVRSPAVHALDRTAGTVLRPYVPFQVPVHEGHPVLCNLQGPETYRRLVENMWRRSPTFRRQCWRIGSEPRLTVVLSVRVLAKEPTARAQTQVTRQAGGMLAAAVWVRAGKDYVELIAHELEHIIEQLDGIDLASKAGRGATGVSHTENGGFETVRAIRAGLKVAQEVRAAGD